MGYKNWIQFKVNNQMYAGIDNYVFRQEATKRPNSAVYVFFCFELFPQQAPEVAS